MLLASLGAQAQDQAVTHSSLTSEFIYKFLVGEIAGQRGDVVLASRLLYELAQSSRDPRLAERAARAAAFGHQQELALRAASLWAELDPQSNEAQQAVSQLMLSIGDLDEARPYLEKLLADPKIRGNVFNYLSGALARHQDKPAALKLIRTLAQPYPDQAEAHLAIAHLAWTANEDELAFKELAAAESLKPGWEVAAALHGEVLLRKSPDDALAFFRKFLAQYPKSDEIRLTYAKLLVSQKDFATARTQFAQLADAAKSNPEIAIVVGLLAGQLGDYKQADTYFLQALERGYKNPDQLYLYLGQSAEKQQHFDQAYSWYNRVEEGELHFDAQLRVASLLAQEKKLDQARNLLHGLTDLTNEQQVMAYQVEANLLAQDKQYEASYAVLSSAVDSLPNTPELIYDLAMAAERVQHYDVMEQQLRKLMVIKPDFAQAYNALGYTLADRNERLDEATKLIEKALSLSPDDHYILDSMGWLQYRLGMLDKAVDYLRRAYADQTDPEIAAHLGEVLWQQGKHEEALKTWNEALHAHPDNEVLLNTTKKFNP